MVSRLFLANAIIIVILGDKLLNTTDKSMNGYIKNSWENSLLQTVPELALQNNYRLWITLLGIILLTLRNKLRLYRIGRDKYLVRKRQHEIVREVSSVQMDGQVLDRETELKGLLKQVKTEIQFNRNENDRMVLR